MRNINADIFSDEWFGTLSPVYRLLWLGLLLNVADDQGRMLDNPALIRATLFPYDDDIKLKEIEKGLAVFAAKHKITRYGHGTNGSTRKLIQVNNWWRYQKSAQWAGRSQYPAPPKWMDRIRIHEKGGAIYLQNWDAVGGYEVPTKPLRRRKVAATKAQDSGEVSAILKLKVDDEKTPGVSTSGVKGAGAKSAAPLPSNFGRGKPKGHTALKAVTHGN